MYCVAGVSQHVYANSGENNFASIIYCICTKPSESALCASQIVLAVFAPASLSAGYCGSQHHTTLSVSKQGKNRRCMLPPPLVFGLASTPNTARRRMCFFHRHIRRCYEE